MSAPYLAATRGSHRQTVQVDAWYGGAPVFGAGDLLVDSGSVTDSSQPGVRRQIDVTLRPAEGLFDLLSPVGTELRVRSVLRFPSGETESVPMGVFDVDSASVGYGPGGAITVRGSDKWVKIQRAKFLRPKASWAGLRITTQIVSLIREVFGPAEPVAVLTSNTDVVGTLVWEQDRDKAIIELAESIGCWVYADRDGIFTIADLPTGTPASPVWDVDSGADGIMLNADRARDRSGTYNVVVTATEKADGVPPFDPVVVWDRDPSSPTYAGADPVVGTSAGPFGIVPYFWTSPVLEHPGQAEVAGLAKLARLSGLNAQLRMSAVRNHALDALDPISVKLPPFIYGGGGGGGGGFGVGRFGMMPFGASSTGGAGSPRYAVPTIIERHWVDKIVHPLTPDGEQTIETRSTRTGVA